MFELQLLRKISVGSAVDAFLANSAAGSVLVQVSHPEIVADAELYGRFLDTTRATSTTHRHPSLLSIEHTSCEDDGRFVMITAPLSGHSARDVLSERGKVTSGEVLRWVRRVCEALEFLHAHGVVHGHLAPRNLFLDGPAERPEVRLLDTALLLFRGTKSVPSGQVLVEPEYLSPERCAGHRATPSCDVYGVGVLLYELLTGRPPFSGVDAAQTRILQRKAPLPPLLPGLEEWGPVLSKCLAKQAMDRFESMAVLGAALRSVVPARTPVVEFSIEALPPQALPLPPEPPPPPPALQASAEVKHDPSRPIQVGDVLGQYRIESLLGEGGMGQVFEATHLSIGRRVALKVLKPELARVEAQVQRFEAEALAVNRVRHPNIIAIEDLIRDSERVYCVMELLQGKSLKVLAREAPIELLRAVRLMHQAADALAAAHSVGVIHRDVKPDNFVINGDHLKVLDFGVARVRGLEVKRAFRTQVGQVVGTPLWMAPEQVMGHQVDGRADLYALAMVMYVLLTRRFPFTGDLSQMVMMRLSKDAEPVGEHTFLGERIPARLQQLLKDGLCRDLSRRPTSMKAFAAELGAIEDELGAPSEIKSRRSSWWNWRTL
jgi:serine/threonine protein kinase